MKLRKHRDKIETFNIVSLEDSANLVDSDIIASEIVEDIRVALEHFSEIASDLKQTK